MRIRIASTMIGAALFIGAVFAVTASGRFSSLLPGTGATALSQTPLTVTSDAGSPPGEQAALPNSDQTPAQDSNAGADDSSSGEQAAPAEGPVRPSRRIERPYTGITYLPVTAPLAKQEGLPQIEGAWISEVAPHGPADQAGLRRGDVILSINSQVVDDTSPLPAALAGCAPGTTVTVTYWRHGESYETRLTLSGRFFDHP